MKSAFTILSFLCLLSYVDAANPIQEFTDPAGDRWWNVSPKDFDPAFDAVKLTVERLAPATIRFTFTTAAAIPAEVHNQNAMFQLFLDLDRNVKTGRDWSVLDRQIGSDLEVNLMWAEGKWFFFPEEAAKHATYEIKGSTVSMTITDPRFAKTEQFNMFAWINGPKGNMDVLPNEGFYEVSLPTKP